MHVLAVAGLTAAYTTGFLITARMLFARWRPSLAVILCQNSCPNRRTGNGLHNPECYRQRGRDDMPYPFTRDIHAAMCAALGGVFWWGMVLYLLITARPPELPAEKEKRLRGLEAKVKELEAENRIGE